MDYQLSSGKGILLSVISDRVNLLKKNCDEINSLLEERQVIKDNLNAKIDEELCRINTALYEMRFVAWSAPIRRNSLERQITELYKEKRGHELSHWKDTVGLKRELRQAEKELRTAMLDLWMVRFLS